MKHPPLVHRTHSAAAVAANAHALMAKLRDDHIAQQETHPASILSATRKQPSPHHNFVQDGQVKPWNARHVSRETRIGVAHLSRALSHDVPGTKLIPVTPIGPIKIPTFVDNNYVTPKVLSPSDILAIQKEMGL